MALVDFLFCNYYFSARDFKLGPWRSDQRLLSRSSTHLLLAALRLLRAPPSPPTCNQLLSLTCFVSSNFFSLCASLHSEHHSQPIQPIFSPGRILASENPNQYLRLRCPLWNSVILLKYDFGLLNFNVFNASCCCYGKAYTL